MEHSISEVERYKPEWKDYLNFKISVSSSQAEILKSPNLLEELGQKAARFDQWMAKIKLDTLLDELIKIRSALVPENGKSNEANNQHNWAYGITTLTESESYGLKMKALVDHYEKGAPGSGHRSHTFKFENPPTDHPVEKIIIGFEVKALRTDKFNGHWINQSSHKILGHTQANISVKGWYARAISWTVVWYYIEKSY